MTVSPGTPRCSGRPLSALLAVLLAGVPMLTHASSHAALAREVNAQIVQRQVSEDVAWMAEASGGMMPRDIPASCEPAMREAVHGMTTELVRFMQEGFNDPVYQRSFEQQLAEVYPAEQLQAFLDRRDTERLDALATVVMAAPRLKAAQDAHLAKLTEAADQAMQADPGMQMALAGVRDAQTLCDAQRMEAEAP
jgi:hypothetical protein